MNANEPKRGDPLAPTNIRCDIKSAELHSSMNIDFVHSVFIDNFETTLQYS